MAPTTNIELEPDNPKFDSQSRDPSFVLRCGPLEGKPIHYSRRDFPKRRLAQRRSRVAEA